MNAGAPATFVDRLGASVTLTLGPGKTFVVPAGNLKRFRLELEPWGFAASLEWWVVSKLSQSEDTLFDDFVKRDLLPIELQLDRTFDAVGETAAPLLVKGLVTSRAVSERSFADVDGEPVLQRQYRVTAEDRGGALWKQHFPVALHADDTLKTLLQANLPEGVRLTIDWAPAEAKHAVQSLPLGASGSVTGGAASYRDYLVWLLDREHGGLFFDAATGAYAIRGVKARAGETIDVPVEDVRELDVLLPEAPRSKVRVWNGHAAASTRQKDGTNAQAIANVRSDHLIVSAIGADLDARSTLEAKRAVAPLPRLRLAFARYPSVTLAPGKTYRFQEDWSTHRFVSGKTFRLVGLSIAAEAERLDPADDVDDDTNGYVLSVEARLESEGEKRFHLPPHATPRWPFFVEGKVVSTLGADDERTWQLRKDSGTSLEYYLVEIPLWKKKVICPHEPHFSSGQFFFPADKGERVLVALEHRGARIERFLDWRAGAVLPKDTQGNHLLFGKKATSETSLRHVYEENKPVLRLARTSAKDTQVLEVKEGVIRLETKEEP